MEPLAAILDRLARGEVSASALVETCLERIRRLDPALRCFITVAAAPARAAARAFDERAGSRGRQPLGGVPYAVKDMFQTRGIATTAGSRVLEGWTPAEDAAAIERLAAAGAILVGKNTQHEFAYGTTGENPHFGTALNPWDPKCIAGGSSGGSAAAVAADLAVFALGTDTGGSVRVPAALCGVVGLKPTFGLVSRHGVIPYSWTLDHVGLLCRCIPDAAAVLQVLAGHDARDTGARSVTVPDYATALHAGVGGLTIGVPRALSFTHVDTQAAVALERALEVWRGAGAAVVDVDLPAMERARTISLAIQLPEALSYHRRHLRERAELYGRDLRDGLATGQFVLAEHYVHAQRKAEAYRRAMDEVLATVDVIATPATPVAAPPVGTTSLDTGGGAEPVGNALTRFTAIFAVTGHPALTVPAGLGAAGLPLGVQVVGRAFDEATVLRVGAALEQRIGRLAPPDLVM